VYTEPVAEAESSASAEAMDSVHIIRQVYYKRSIVRIPHSYLNRNEYMHHYN